MQEGKPTAISTDQIRIIRNASFWNRGWTLMHADSNEQRRAPNCTKACSHMRSQFFSKALPASSYRRSSVSIRGFICSSRDHSTTSCRFDSPRCAHTGIDIPLNTMSSPCLRVSVVRFIWKRFDGAAVRLFTHPPAAHGRGRKSAGARRKWSSGRHRKPAASRTSSARA